MADDKKNIPDAGKVDESPKPGKVEPIKADSTVQEPAPAKTESPVVEGTPQPGKDEKQTTIPGMGDPAPAGKVVDFTAARDGAAKGKPPEKAAAPDKGKQADKAKDAAKPRRGRPARADKAAPDKAKPQPRDKMSQSKPPAGKGAPATAKAPAATEQPPTPRDATRGVKEEIVYLNLSEDYKSTEQAARYCRAVYEAGFSPICPTLYLPLFLNDAVPEEHKSGIDMSRDLLRRSHVLVVCGHTVTEAMKNDIAVAQRLGITATTLEGILTVKGQGRR